MDVLARDGVSGSAARRRAALGSLLFLLVAPGVVAGVIPWWLTGWYVRTTWWPVQLVGVVLIALGVVVLLEAFTRFVLEGLGTPAPVAPTEQLVVGGLYRYVRNPMYLAVAVVAAFVHWYEEPTLARTFGDEYNAYRRAVPGWWPRRRPWKPDRTGGAST